MEFTVQHRGVSYTIHETREVYDRMMSDPDNASRHMDKMLVAMRDPVGNTTTANVDQSVGEVSVESAGSSSFGEVRDGRATTTMDHLRSLYKANGSVLIPKNCKRKIANELRASKRSELYSSSRNMSLSPQPVPEHKENFKPPIEVAPVRLEPAPPVNVPSPKLSEKLLRQKAFVMRYVAWKANKAKEAEQNSQKLKRPPFVVPTRGTAPVESRNVVVKKSFAPKNHVFNPPANIKDLQIEVTGANSIRCVYGDQQACFQFVPTPKKKPMVQSHCGAIKPAAALKPKKPVAHKMPIAKPTVPVTNSKPRLPLNSNKKTPTAPPKGQPTTAGKPKVIKPTEMPPPPKSATKPPAKINLMPKMPPPPQQVPQITRRGPTQTTINSKSKSGLLALKRPTFKAPKKTNSSISNTELIMNTRKPPPVLKLNNKTLLNGTTKSIEPITATPTDPQNSVNPYPKFVTSTKRKSTSGSTKADLIFVELGNIISPVDDISPTPKAPLKVLEEKSHNKFKFVQYEAIQDIAVKQKPEEPAAAVTPEKTATASPPTTYMSPYVSVSRGKVSTRTEREKRNSIYMVADAETSPEKTPEVRHTLATVCYYRKQLMDEIARLNARCALWEEYKQANAELVLDGGIDMINVTIGQTKLLTTKKLKQFAGLIDRCENGVRGKTSTGEGESAKPILPEDLEGFWSMVGLQIENVDKRFAELERWKANNWSDPDDVPATKPANVKKTRKRKSTTTSAKPNSALQKMLRTAHAAYLNKKAVGATDEDVILTPSKSRQVLIRDRRSRSAAATIITVNAPRTNRKSSAFDAQPSTDLNETPKMLPNIGAFRKSINLLKSALLNDQERKSPFSPIRNQAAFRKSILKTPGSRSRPKSVIFNSPTLKFTIEDVVDEDAPRPAARDENQEAEDQRTYKLRNRRIVLRDSAEFVIPK